MCQFFTLDLKQQERIHWEKRESCLFLFFFTNAWANPSRSLSRSKTLSIEPAGFINWAWFGLIFFTNKLRKWNLKIKKKKREGFNYFTFITLHAAASPPESTGESLLLLQTLPIYRMRLYELTKFSKPLISLHMLCWLASGLPLES